MADVIDIDDPADPRLDRFRDLAVADRRPDLPVGRGIVLAEGALVVRRMLASRFTPIALLGVERRRAELAADLDAIPAPFYRATAPVMAQVVGFHLNRGVLAAAPRPPELPLDQVLAGAATVAVLEGVNDHENLGAMFRNAAGLGVDAVLLGPRCADPLYRRSVRVSMGYVLRVPFARIADTRSDASWPVELDRLRERGFRLVALTPRPTARPLPAAVQADRVALLFGAEGPGLSDEAMRAADVSARIPMPPDVDSLNVATAAALAFYERLRGSG
ncbi:RNA methyltransferase [Skermania piniformis]|uniref:RNA methyltransferase n=1 Tax=Skermania pinensis TaxID=39122 RepID=A0ABX8S7E4_9ACTN|nr:RNA methyltransferase [Skermania piniformis]QXQ13391.1 RNA methyltransferase [Skermania piniformis]